MRWKQAYVKIHEKKLDPSLEHIELKCQGLTLSEMVSFGFRYEIAPMSQAKCGIFSPITS